MQKNCKSIIYILTTMILALTIISGTKAETQNDLQLFFSREKFFPGISLKIYATAETVPGANITIRVWINCTAEGVKVNYLNLTVYGFEGGQTKVPLCNIDVLSDEFLVVNNQSERSYNVSVPFNFWGDTYADMSFRYSIYATPFEYAPSFSMTIVRNVYYEQLQEDFNQLNETLIQLQKFFWKASR